MEADFQQFYNLDMWSLVYSGGFKRAARLLWQLPKESRFINALDPAASWGWNDLFLMQMNQSLRWLVWAKTKDAQSKVPKSVPELVAPDFILNAIREAEKKRDQAKERKLTPNARIMTIDELDEYLKKPRRSEAV